MIARWLLPIVLLTFLIWPAAARQATDANLITAIDVSGSIRTGDERLEFEGMAQAVVDPRFLQAVARGRHGRIGFVAFSWANGEFIPLVPWTLIGSQAEAQQVADQLQTAASIPRIGYAMGMPSRSRPWRSGHATDISAAIERAVAVSANAPFSSWHNVINICGNGIDNVGDGPAAARDRADAAGLIVNGLILGNRDDADDIAAYFREQVQAGPGSFVMVARSFQDITSAMLAKFLVELAALPPAASKLR